MRPIINEKNKCQFYKHETFFAFVFLAFFHFGTEKIVQAIQPYESLTTKDEKILQPFLVVNKISKLHDAPRNLGSSHRLVPAGPDPQHSLDHPPAAPIKSNKIIYRDLTL
ncbi:hypothetical protein H5410_061806 [Solanum commersonii]|uniref:Uncharacterized protein n=1 Tax=Solanum commersonii TaxID=4109 RepID=A0A9J5WAB0_SOLCO|nr:hypothetical protein H5410_061806 [Solanum commersonii]